MARTTPNKEFGAVIHLSAAHTTLLIAWFAVVVTIVAGVCVSKLHWRFLKSSKSRSKQKQASSSSSIFSFSGGGKKNTKATQDFDDTVGPSCSEVKLPLPPQEQSINDGSGGIQLRKSKSRRNFSTGNLSLKLPEGLTRMMSMRKEHKAEAGSEDSIWKKTIILGERCKAPNVDEDEGVVYDKKGHRRKMFHPKTPRSLPVSRNNSFSEEKFPAVDELSGL